MRDILTITLNPALDLATSVDQVIAGPKLRCKSPRIDPGGGGVNVARTIGKLGGHVTALVAIGGATGAQLCNLLSAENIPFIPVPVSGETRQSFAVTDETSGAQYRFGLPGEELTSTDATHLLSMIHAAAPPDGLTVISGSVAPGLPPDFLQQVIASLTPIGSKLIIDTAGPGLAQLIAAPTQPVHLLRVDQKEANEAAGHPLITVADTISFAAGLIARGVAEIVISGRGAEGSLLVSANQRLFCKAAHVPVRSAIGAGDAFVGAMTLALARDEPLDQALQWGVAAASATVGTEGTALCDLQSVTALLPLCTVTDV